MLKHDKPTSFLEKRRFLRLFYLFFCSMGGLFFSPHAVAAGGHLDVSGWWILPFVVLLACMAIASFFQANFPEHHISHWWENNFNKLKVALICAACVLPLFAINNRWDLLHHYVIQDFIAFFVLLFALFVITSGIYLHGDLRATPSVNATFLGVGAVLANFVGTTGASILLIRPLLRTNSEREYTTHIPVFFIFIVSNVGGCLLPIGDPPLFMGYLQGVPFEWTLLHLWDKWLFTIVLLLIIFYVFDTVQYRRETQQHIQLDNESVEPLRIVGWRINLPLLIIVLLAVIFITPTNLQKWGLADNFLGSYLREWVMLGATGLSLWLTPQVIHDNNGFDLKFKSSPIWEVGFLFFGIFIVMIPALEWLHLNSAHYLTAWGWTHPTYFFWISGSLSAVLDNAPTYLIFFAAARGITGQETLMSAQMLPEFSTYLVGISLGAVFMGAMTYIGNAPNLMVRAISRQQKCEPPDFFSYLLYSCAILLPVFFIMVWVFL